MKRDAPEDGAAYYGAAETLAHRVRHVFAVIRSIAARTAAHQDEDVQNYAAHLDGRIDAFARAQMGLILQSSAGLELEDILRDELVAQSADAAQYALEGPTVVLPARVAEVLTLAFHELATNATKFGALSHPEGSLDITWRLEDGAFQHVKLDWIERGVDGAHAEREGFGLELITRQAPYEIGGRVKLSFTSDGLHCEMSFPIASSMEAEK